MSTPFQAAVAAITTALTPFLPIAPTSTPPNAPRVQPSTGQWPLAPQPPVLRAFDPPEVVWGAGHRGVDLLGSVGQPVRAAVAGTVSFAGSVGGKWVVVIAHGETRTTYEPVVTSLGVGTVVIAGQQIGTLDGAPSHCAPRACLHWGLRAGERYLDPLTLLGAPPPIRLVPLEGLQR